MKKVFETPAAIQGFKLSTLPKITLKSFLIPVVLLLVVAGVGYGWYAEKTSADRRIAELKQTQETLSQDLQQVTQEYETLKTEDQLVKNQELLARITEIEKNYGETVRQYERLLDLRGDGVKTDKLDEQIAESLSLLAKQNYASASALLAQLSKDITAEQDKLKQAAALAIPQAPVNNQAPATGYSRQSVQTEIGTYVVSMVAGDLSSTRVIVDTASSSDCRNDCPVKALGDYVARNGGFAGINGTYFCPASYPECADKKNSYDLLVMNKDKVYFNSDNNVHSVNPAVIFRGGSVQFLGAASSWGRDTGIDSMISNFPLLMSGGEIRFAGDGDPKKGSKGNRSFVANKGNTVYIGVVHGATVAEAAWALKGLGMENAMNLDSGGSTALWAGGYKAGPGRAIPNAIVFVRR